MTLGSLLPLLLACGGTDQTEDQLSFPAVSVDDAPGNDMPKIDVPDSNEAINVSNFDIFTINSTSVDASGFADVAVVNVGVDPDDARLHASPGRMDFDQLQSSDLTLNIFAEHAGVELDFTPQTDPDVEVNFNIDAPVTTSGAATGTAFELHHVSQISFHHSGQGAVTVLGEIDLNDITTSLAVTTANEGGDLFLGLTSTSTAVTHGGALQTISLSAINGDLTLQQYDPNIFPGDFVDDISALQSYFVLAQNAHAEIGSLGKLGPADDLELIEIKAEQNGTIDHAELYAGGADISQMVVTSTDSNSIYKLIAFFSPLNGNYNIVQDELLASRIDFQQINALDGGHILLKDQGYLVGEQVFTGSGNITIDAADLTFPPTLGYVQTQPADASAHSGERLFVDGQSLDIFYGSDAADTIFFQGYSSPFATEPGGIYYDSGGDDLITIRGDDIIVIYDGDAGTDDIVDFTRSGFLGNLRLEFNVGSGDDTILLSLPGFSLGASDQMLIDFGARVSGTVYIENLVVPTHQISFDGLEGITTTQALPILSSGVGVGALDSNSIYLVEDGDTPVFGSSIANYTDLNDVANFLSAGLMSLTSEDDAAIFVIHNSSTTTNGGDTKDVYFYHYVEQGNDGIITLDDLTLLGSASLFAGSGATTPPLIAPADIS